MQPQRLAVIVVISACLALPLGGFVFGFMNCEDCGWNVLGRAFVGLVFAVLTPITGGFPPRDVGGAGDPFNAWPHILVTWGLLVSLLAYRAKRKSRKEKSMPPPEPPRAGDFHH